MSDLFFEKGKIRVTKNLFSNGQGNNFFIANVRHIRDEHKAKSVLPLVVGVIAGLVGGFAGPLFPYSELMLSGFGGVLTTWYFLSKDRHAIYLTTPQGEIKAFEHKKEALCAEVLRALKRAVAAHNGV